MKWLMIAAPLVVGLVAAVSFLFAAGALLPRQHKASRSAVFAAPPEAVWGVLSDFANHASWRPGLRSVEVLAGEGGRRRLREVNSHKETIEYEIVEFEPPRRMVSRIATRGLPYGGSWTYELTPEGAGTRVRVTEDGEVYNTAFRYIARCMGYTGTMEKYLRALGRKLGEEVKPGA